MKPGHNNKRSRGRNNQRRPNHAPRSTLFESNGPEVRIRGTVNQVLEKYLALARDASSSGDHIAAENYFQHAEHYFRILNANGGQRFRGPGGQPPRSNGEIGRPDAAPAPGAPAGEADGPPSEDEDFGGPDGTPPVS